MAVNVTGDEGSLEWHASFDVNDFVAGTQKIEQSLQQTLAKTEQISKLQNDALVGSIPNFNKLINTQSLDEAVAKIKVLQQQEEALRQSLAGASEPVAISKLNTGLDEVQHKLQAAKEGIILLGNQTINTSVNTSDPAKLVEAYQQLKILKEQLISISGSDPQLNTLLSQAEAVQQRLIELHKDLDINATVTLSSNVDAIDKKINEIPKQVDVVITPAVANNNVDAFENKLNEVPKEVTVVINPVAENVSVIDNVEQKINELPKEVNVNIDTTVKNANIVDTVERQLAEIPKNIEVEITPVVANSTAIQNATKTSLEAAGTTWREFVAERMADYRTIEGSNEAALQRITEEWKAYKATISDTVITPNVQINTNLQEATESQTQFTATVLGTTAATEQLISKEKELSNASGKAATDIQNAGKSNVAVAKTYDEVKGSIEAAANALQKKHTAMVQQAEDDAKAARQKTQVNNNPFSVDYSKLTNTADDAVASNDKVSESLDNSQKKASLFTAATNALNVAQVTQVAGTEEVTAAQAVLNGVLDANPIGIVLIGITALAEAYKIFEDQAKQSTAASKEFYDSLNEANKVFIELINSANKVNRDNVTAAENALALAQSQGKSENELLQLRLKVTDAKKYEQLVTQASLDLGKQNLDASQKDLDFINQKIHALETLKGTIVTDQGIFATLKNVASIGLTGTPSVSFKNIGLDNNDQSQLDLLKSQKAEIETLLNKGKEANQQLIAGDAEAAQIRAEQIKKEHDDAIKSAAAEADARLLLVKKNTAEELALRIDAINKEAAQELLNVNLTAGERDKIEANRLKQIQDAERNYGILQLNNEKAIIQGRLDEVRKGSAAELDLKIELVKNQSQIELAAEGVTSQQRFKIQKDLAKQIADLTKDYQLNAQKELVDTDISNINSRLTLVKAGSEEELQLKKELIDKKADLDAFSAIQTIDNQVQLQAKLREINLKAFADQAKLEQTYDADRLKRQVEAIENATLLANIPLNRIVKSPTSSDNEKASAQKQILENDLDGVQKQIDAVGKEYIQNKGDVDALEKQLNALIIKKGGLKSSIDLLDQEKNIKDLETLTGRINEAADGLTKMADAVAPFNKRLSDSLNTLSSITSTAGDVTKILTELAKGAQGDPVAIAAAGVDVITRVVDTLVAAKKTAVDAAAKMQSYQDSLIQGEVSYNELLRERERSQTNLNALTLSELQARKQMLAIQKQQAQADFNTLLNQIQSSGQQITGQHTEKQKSIIGGLVGYFSNFGAKTSVVQDLAGLSTADYDTLQKLYTENKLTDQTKAWFEQLQKAHDELDAIGESAKEAADQLSQIFTGTTAQNIADSIKQGLEDGKRSVSDFADDLNKLFTDAIFSALEAKTIAPAIQAFYDKFSELSQSGGVLTTDEIAKLKAIYNADILEFSKQVDQLQSISGINLTNTANSSVNSLTGAIKGITEQTAELLAGQFGGLRVTAFDQLNVARQQLNVLNEIQNNTSLIKDLVDYNRKFDTQGIKIRA